MNGVTFGTLHSFNDLFLVLVRKTIGTPETKVKQVEIEGADGFLDYTEYFGEPKYLNRTISLEFATIVDPSTFPTLFSTVQDALHGKKVNITFDDDSGWYYKGRLAVSEFTNEKGIGHLNIECDCEPYKYKSNVTESRVYLYGKNIFDCSNVEQGGLNSTIGTKYSDLKTTSTNRLRSVYPFFVKPSTHYTITIPTGFNADIRFLDSNGILTFATGWTNGTATFITNELTDSIAIYIQKIDTATIIPSDIAEEGFQIEEGISATTFEAFVTDAEEEVVLSNSRKNVVPTLKIGGSVSIEFGTYTKNASWTTFTDSSILLKEGNNNLTISGGGAVVIRYQERKL